MSETFLSLDELGFDSKTKALIKEVEGFEPVKKHTSVTDGETRHPEEPKAAQKVKQKQVQRNDGKKESSARRR